MMWEELRLHGVVVELRRSWHPDRGGRNLPVHGVPVLNRRRRTRSKSPEPRRSNADDVLAQTLAVGHDHAWPLEDARAGSGLMGGRSG